MNRRRPTRADVFHGAYDWFSKRAAIVAGSRRADRFTEFGTGSWFCFPPAALFGEHGIVIGQDTMIGPYCSISAGMGLGQELISDRIVSIGDRCLIGRGSSIVGHLEIVIEDDVFFGPNVYVTDQNHGVDDPTLPIGKQTAGEKPVRIGAGSWLGTGSVVLPGVTIGEHVAIGANSVVTKDLAPFSVAVGAPAQVIRTTHSL